VNTVDNKQTAAPSLGISLGDIYYVLFRQKLKIVLFSALGVLAATGFYWAKPPLFQSEAKLFILYVVTTQVPKLSGPEANVKTPDERGENIMNSEVEILTSMDLVQQTVDTFGADKILAKAGGGDDRIRAAAFIKSNLTVETPKRSDVIRVVLQHPDPQVVQPVLSSLIDNYIKRHIEIHRAVGIIHDLLTQETDQMRLRLEQTEQELHTAKSKADVLSLDDARRAYTDQISEIRRNILSAAAELAERQAEFQEMRKTSVVPVVRPATVAPTTAPPSTPPPPELRMKPDDEYQHVLERLDFLRKKKMELRTQYTEHSVLVKGINDQIVEAENRKRQLEAANPSLTMISIPTATPAATPASAPASAPGSAVAYPQPATSYDSVTESAKIMALQTRIKILNAQLDQIRIETSRFDEKGDIINELQRKKELQEASYRFYANSLEQARIEEALGAGKVLNINKIQTPSPPFRDWFVTLRLLATIVMGGILAGIALAFVSDLYLDRSIRRPVDVEKKLRLPLLLTIRDIGWFGRRRVAKANQRMLQRTDASAGGGLSEETAGLVPKLFNDPLLPFYEALRDRLDQRLESRNLDHKPKFIGVTAVDENAGVTTLATGLAVSLSETENRNVLLIDLDRDLGVAKQFYKGQITEHDLGDALDPKYKVLIQNSDGTGGEPDFEKLAHVLRNQYPDILKKLKVSEYDCVVFDMSPIAPTSITLRLAGFMDEVVLVIESEKTNQDVAGDGISLLLESKISVSAVLNKIRNYVPSSLHQEFWGGV